MVGRSGKMEAGQLHSCTVMPMSSVEILLTEVPGLKMQRKPHETSSACPSQKNPAQPLVRSAQVTRHIQQQCTSAWGILLTPGTSEQVTASAASVGQLWPARTRFGGTLAMGRLSCPKCKTKPR
jgi:hypothetical protein